MHHKSCDYKLTAVKHYLREKNQEMTSQIFECSARSLMSWVKQYQETGTVKRHNSFSISYKVERKHVDYLLRELHKNKTISMKDLHELL